MTVLYAFEATNLDSLNLNYWYNDDTFAEAELNHMSPGSDFEYDYHLRTDDNDILSFYGSDFAVNPEYHPTFVTDGFLNDLVQWAFDGIGAYNQRWVWEDWDVPIYSVWNAGNTEDIADDQVLLEFVLKGRDTFYLSMFDDDMNAYQGHDTLYGYAGNDTLRGGFGHDKLNGGSGHDRLYGDNGNDRLFGSDGRDVLRGGQGNDRLRGGERQDVLIGGNGADVFDFRPGDDIDIVRDLQSAQGDRVDLSRFDIDMPFSQFIKTYVTRYGDNLESAKIDFGDGDVLIIRDIEKHLLDAGDFIF